MNPLLLAVLLPVLAPSDADVVGHFVPAGRHLGSLRSTLAGRVSSDGVIDTGAARVVLVDGDGAPLVPRDMRYGEAANLWIEWTADADGAELTVRVVGLPVAREGDVRLAVSILLEVVQRSDAERDVRLRARLLAGGGDGPRPAHALPFDPDAVASLDEGLVRRGGAALAVARGVTPEITVHETVAGPDDPFAEFAWTIATRYAEVKRTELHVAGPPTTEHRAEESWSSAFRATVFRNQQERVDWEIFFQGEAARFRWNDERVRRALVGGTLFLRALGEFRDDPVVFSDRPYGHPASDAAAEAEIVGALCEWNFGPNLREFLIGMLEEAPERGAGLPAHRRLAYLHGLATATRLRPFNRNYLPAMARAIDALVPAEAAVAPWLDPDLVRADLQELLDAAAALEPELEPRALPDAFAWADPPAGSAARTMVAARRALSAGDVPGAWSQVETLLEEHASVEGLGALGGDELEGRFTVGLLSLLRAMVVDDHRGDLILMPAVPLDFVPRFGDFANGFVDTRYGRVHLQAFQDTARRFQGNVLPLLRDQPGLFLIGVPGGERPRRVDHIRHGNAVLHESGMLELTPDDEGKRIHFKIWRPGS